MTNPRVIVPFTRPNGWGTPDVRAVDLACRQQGVVPEFVDVGGSETDYWALWSFLWLRGETFIILEHDTIPWNGVLAEMFDCRKPWCTMPYAIVGQGTSVDDALGCAKFMPTGDRKLPLQIPDEYRSWRKLDRGVARVLRDARMKPHRHGPPGIHLHDSHLSLAQKAGWARDDFPASEARPLWEYTAFWRPWPQQRRRRLFQRERPMEQEVYEVGPRAAPGKPRWEP